MKKSFGMTPSGEQAHLYTISCGGLVAEVTDFGAHLVSLMVPDKNGNVADVVLGYDSAEGYANGNCFFGATVGRSANRIKGATFQIGSETVKVPVNENDNNLHSGPDYYHLRMWDVVFHSTEAITLRLISPDGDQGFPGKASIDVTYSLDSSGGLHIEYDAISDKDTVFNLTNHSYFNLAGHEKLNAMDLRTPKIIGQDINADYDALNLQGGYDHNWEVLSNPCATLTDPVSGRSMYVFTDCPGVQFYAGNYITEQTGKGGVTYCKRSGICLETQFYPDSVNHPEWAQPIVKAGVPFHSETVYKFY